MLLPLPDFLSSAIILKAFESKKMVSLEDRKGVPARIKSKEYKECKAWLDTGKRVTKCKVPVIIQLDDGSLKATRIDKENVDDPFSEPTSYEEAALQQLADIDYKMDILARDLARCRIQATDEMLRIFGEKLDRACTVQVSKGSRARWIHVNWDDEN